MDSQHTHPIVLAHGIARFDVGWNKLIQLDNQDDPFLDLFHYFRGIRTMLMKHGFTVYHSSVSWADTVTNRAEELRKNLQEILAKPEVEKVKAKEHIILLNYIFKATNNDVAQQFFHRAIRTC